MTSHTCVTPTAPECPLHAVILFEPLREEEVQDRAQAGEGQSQTESQGQLLPFEPERRDAVLNDWQARKRQSNLGTLL